VSASWMACATPLTLASAPNMGLRWTRN